MLRRRAAFERRSAALAIGRVKIDPAEKRVTLDNTEVRLTALEYKLLPRTKFPLEGQEQILGLAAQVENLGASAYLGAAAMIQSEDLLGTALSIHSVEARHAAALNIATGKEPVPFGDSGLARPATMDAVLEMVKPFIVS